MVPKLVSVFNNKGGVGKTTLTFHLAHALAAMGKRVLLLDLDPQCNLTIYCMENEAIHHLWREEDQYIDDPGYERARIDAHNHEYEALCSAPRSVHFLLKPTEEGTSDPSIPPSALQLKENLFLVPGRLSLHMFEDRIAERWPRTYASDPLSIRTVTKIRQLALQLADQHDIDVVLLDTSPSLGSLNKTVIWTADAFLVPCAPDLFSLYGIRNIGNALTQWASQYETLQKVLSAKSIEEFPSQVVTFIGYTLYNAKLYTGSSPLNIAKGQSKYAEDIPEALLVHIPKVARGSLSDDVIKKPIGDLAIIHSHNTFPAMAQTYKCPMWEVPNAELDQEHRQTVAGNRSKYFETLDQYKQFASEFLDRLEMVGE